MKRRHVLQREEPTAVVPGKMAPPLLLLATVSEVSSRS
jgi:hypothetical protein